MLSQQFSRLDEVLFQQLLQSSNTAQCQVSVWPRVCCSVALGANPHVNLSRSSKGLPGSSSNLNLELKNSHQREVLIKKHFSETLRSHYLDLHLLRTGRRVIHLQSVPSSRQKKLAGAARSTEGLREM